MHAASRRRVVYMGIAILVGITGGLAIQQYEKGAEDRAIAYYQREAKKYPGDFNKQQALYQGLLTKIDPVHAQYVLAATLTRNSRSHMIGHETGYVLYREEGLAGISKCRSELLNDSCLHGVLELFTVEHGIEGIVEASQACRSNPTIGQARECPHGVGHGFMTLVGYKNLPDALRLCHQAFTEGDPEWACFDGVFMENNVGDSDTDVSERWYLEGDPMYPCNDPRVEAFAQAHDACWFNQSLSTLDKVKYPVLEASSTKVAEFCEALDRLDEKRCFVGLARQIQRIYAGNAPGIIDACNTLGSARAGPCMVEVARTGYDFGDRKASLTLCEHLHNRQDPCYEALYERITSYEFQSAEQQKTTCDEVFEGMRRTECIKWIDSHRMVSE